GRGLGVLGACRENCARAETYARHRPATQKKGRAAGGTTALCYGCQPLLRRMDGADSTYLTQPAPRRSRSTCHRNVVVLVDSMATNLMPPGPKLVAGAAAKRLQQIKSQRVFSDSVKKLRKPI